MPAPAPTIPAPTVLTRLRHETRPQHEALETLEFNRLLSAGTPSAAATRHFLAKMYGFVLPYEAALRALAPTLGPAWEVPARQRAQLLAHDLGGAAVVAALPLCAAMPPLGTVPALLGAMYVLEGSTLGGQVIARQLAKAGLPGPFTYFAGYGPATGSRWKTFCALLGEAATEPATQDAVVASAGRTFHQLAAWLQTP